MCATTSGAFVDFRNIGVVVCHCNRDLRLSTFKRESGLLFCFFELGFLCVTVAVLHFVDQASLILKDSPASDH